MISIYDYLDYRDFLADYYKVNKEKRYMSYRMFGREINTDPSLLVKIFQKNRHLKKTVLNEVNSFCKLNAQEARFLSALYDFTKAKTQVEIQENFELLNQIKGVQKNSLSIDQYSFYSKWYYSALWALLNIEAKGTPSFYAKKLNPPITTAETKEAFRVLENIGLIKKINEDEYQIFDKHIVTDNPKVKSAIRNFHHEMIHLADKSIENIDPNLRDISTVSAAVDQDCLFDIKEILNDTRLKIQSRVDRVQEANQVIQINFQVFPLSHKVKL